MLGEVGSKRSCLDLILLLRHVRWVRFVNGEIGVSRHEKLLFMFDIGLLVRVIFWWTRCFGALLWRDALRLPIC